MGEVTPSKLIKPFPKSGFESKCFSFRVIMFSDGTGVHERKQKVIHENLLKIYHLYTVSIIARRYVASFLLQTM